eukprot:c11940_g1_i1.p1 GENE.c11940_g1_i1~~c11940_g1_i1.p1  ORF type:complete len:455 (+),score=117.42 c11940_g1_i1:46-1410(+)
MESTPNPTQSPSAIQFKVQHSETKETRRFRCEAQNLNISFLRHYLAGTFGLSEHGNWVIVWQSNEQPTAISNDMDLTTATSSGQSPLKLLVSPVTAPQETHSTHGQSTPAVAELVAKLVSAFPENPVVASMLDVATRPEHLPLVTQLLQDKNFVPLFWSIVSRDKPDSCIAMSHCLLAALSQFEEVDSSILIVELTACLPQPPPQSTFQSPQQTQSATPLYSHARSWSSSASAPGFSSLSGFVNSVTTMFSPRSNSTSSATAFATSSSANLFSTSSSSSTSSATSNFTLASRLKAEVVRGPSVKSGTRVPAGSRLVPAWEVKNVANCDWQGVRLVACTPDPFKVGSVPVMPIQNGASGMVFVVIEKVPAELQGTTVTATFQLHDQHNLPFGDLLTVSVLVPADQATVTAEETAAVAALLEMGFEDSDEVLVALRRCEGDLNATALVLAGMQDVD